MSRLRLASALVLSAAFACSSEESTPASATADGGTGTTPTPSDGGVSSGDDSATTPDAKDAATGTDASKIGETCVGYGAGDTCQAEQGKPFGYVCFGGPPPGIDGCKETRTSATLGNNYCCSENDCVEQIDQSAQCNGVSGKPRRVQCPPAGDAGNVAPPAGCVEHESGATALEKLYCCPP